MNYSKNASKDTPTAKKRKKNKKRKNSVVTILLRIFVILIIISGFAVFGAFLGAYMGIIESAPPINTSDAVPENYTSILYDANGNEIDRLHGEENREYVKLSVIPDDLKNAVIAIEDERFYQHNGVDIRGMARALMVNVTTMDFSQGASTLTQQLMKNEILSSEKKLQRKLQEQYLAVNFEKALEESLGSKEKSKDYILELYLNTMALNHGLNGVQAASLFYFEKDVSELTLAESAAIAGITKNPSAYSPLTRPEANKTRQGLILDSMLRLGFITQSEHDIATAEDIYSNIAGKTKSEEDTGIANHSYFVDSAIVALADQLVSEKGMSRQQAYNLIYSGGLKIYLTVDPKMQSIMEESFSNDALFPPSGTSYTVTYTISVMDNKTEEQTHISREEIVSNEGAVEAFVQSVKDEVLNDTNTFVLDKITVAKSLQAAMTVMDYHNGHVKAIVGGREKTGDLVFNRATQALRQPGSCFKVLAAYAPAIDLGLVMPGTVIVDEAFTYNGWSPRNWYSSGFRGPRTVRQGIESSLNILAAKTIVQVGVDTAYDYLVNFGFTSLVESRSGANGIVSDKIPALSLGGITDGISVLELTAAYGTIANDGVYAKPVFYTKVLDHNGNILIDNTEPETRRVLKTTTAYMLTDMMRDVLTGSGGTGHLARFSNVRMPIAGKTGTTSDDKDLIFAGYTPYYVAGIWMGYDIPKRMSYDKSYHLLLWKDVMEKIHVDLETRDFVRPSGLTTKTICAVTGKSPTAFCELDYFGTGVSTDLVATDFHGANASCDAHRVIQICEESLHLPSEHCLHNHVIDIVVAIDEDGNIINNHKSQDGTLLENAIHLDKICDLAHEPIIDPNEVPDLPEPNPVEANEIPYDPMVNDGLPGLSDLPEQSEQ